MNSLHFDAVWADLPRRVLRLFHRTSTFLHVYPVLNWILYLLWPGVKCLCRKGLKPALPVPIYLGWHCSTFKYEWLLSSVTCGKKKYSKVGKSLALYISKQVTRGMSNCENCSKKGSSLTFAVELHWQCSANSCFHSPVRLETSLTSARICIHKFAISFLEKTDSTHSAMSRVFIGSKITTTWYTKRTLHHTEDDMWSINSDKSAVREWWQWKC